MQKVYFEWVLWLTTILLNVGWLVTFLLGGHGLTARSLGDELGLSLECPGLSLSYTTASHTRLLWSCHALPHKYDVGRIPHRRSPLGERWLPGIISLTLSSDSVGDLNVELDFDRLPITTVEDPEKQDRSVELWDTLGGALTMGGDHWLIGHRLSGQSHITLFTRDEYEASHVLRQVGQLHATDHLLAMAAGQNRWRVWVRNHQGGITQLSGQWKRTQDELSLRVSYDRPTSTSLAISAHLVADQLQVVWRDQNILYRGTESHLGEVISTDTKDLLSDIDESELISSRGGVRPWLSRTLSPWRWTFDERPLLMPLPECLEGASHSREDPRAIWGVVSAQRSPHLVSDNLVWGWRFAPKLTKSELKSSHGEASLAEQVCQWHTFKEKWIKPSEIIGWRGRAPRWIPTQQPFGDLFLTERGELLLTHPDLDRTLTVKRRAIWRGAELAQAIKLGPSTVIPLLELGALWSLFGGPIWLSMIVLISLRKRKGISVFLASSSLLMSILGWLVI